MMTNVNLSYWAVLAVGGLLVLQAAWCALAWWWVVRSVRKRADAAGVAEEAALARIEVRLRQANIAQRAAVGGSASSGPYKVAIGLAREGMDPAQIAATCGLDESEAELVSRVHALRVAQG